MDEVYCSPFAINIRRLDAVLQPNFLRLEEITFGLKPTSWTQLIQCIKQTLDTGDNQNNKNTSGNNQQEQPKSNSSTRIIVNDLSVYYQPLNTITPNPSLSSSTGNIDSMFIVPPRAILTFGFIKVIHSIQ